MIMTIQTKFSIDDKVKIRELSCQGRILSVWIVSRGIQYEVRYFHNGDAKTVYFWEDELEKNRTSL